MKFLTVLLFASLTFLSGCVGGWSGAGKALGDVTIATATFPACRAELERFLPPSELSGLQGDFELLDNTYAELIVMVKGDADIGYLEALDRIVNVPVTSFELETAFIRITTRTRLYAKESNRTSTFLNKCDSDIRQAWVSLQGTGKARDFILTYGPYAKAAATLLLLEKEAEKPQFASVGTFGPIKL